MCIYICVCECLDVDVSTEINAHDAFSMMTLLQSQVRCSIVVSISACHAEDPGSIPGGGTYGLADG